MSKAEQQPKRTRAPATPSRPNDLGIRIPIDAASWSIGKDVSGSWERCRWYANGVAIDRWAIDEVAPSLDLIATRWGRGRFRLAFLDKDGQAKGVSRALTIDDPRYPLGSTYPNKPANGSNGATPAPASDQEAKLLAIAQGKLDPASTMLTIFSLLNTDAKQRAEDAERRARQEIEHVRERAKIERDEDERRWSRQRDEDEARAKRRLDEEAAAFARERARQEQAGAGQGSAAELALLKAKLEALEGTNGDDKPSFWEEKIGGLIEQIEPGDVQRVTSALWEALGDAALKKKAEKGATP